ncbi:MAG: hypothetical protein AB7O57_04290 [Hyphomicrobiaceae bacterium]
MIDAELRARILAGEASLDEMIAVGHQVNEEQQRSEDVQRSREARILARCFETPAGCQALALLRAKTIDRPPTDEELRATSVEAFALAQARRQGAANLVFQVLAALDYARGIEKEHDNG